MSFPQFGNFFVWTDPLKTPLYRFRMKMDVSDFGNLRTLSNKISLAHKSSGGKWLYMRETLEGADKLANVGLLLLGKVTIKC